MERNVDLPPFPSAEVKERVELYTYCTFGPSWPVIGRTLLLPTCRGEGEGEGNRYSLPVALGAEGGLGPGDVAYPVQATGAPGCGRRLGAR